VKQIGTVWWVIIVILLLIPFGIPITLITIALIAIITFVISYTIGLSLYILVASILFSVARFYARYALRIGILAYVVLWTLVGYGFFDNNPILSILRLWKELIIWVFVKLSLNSIIPYETII